MQAHGAPVTASASAFGTVQSRGAGLASGTAQANGGTGTAEVTPGITSFALLGPFGDEVTDDRPEFAWQPQMSGKTETEAVAEYGMIMCTVCFPTAPADPA